MKGQEIPITDSSAPTLENPDRQRIPSQPNSLDYDLGDVEFGIDSQGIPTPSQPNSPDYDLGDVDTLGMEISIKR